MFPFRKNRWIICSTVTKISEEPIHTLDKTLGVLVTFALVQYEEYAAFLSHTKICLGYHDLRGYMMSLSSSRSVSNTNESLLLKNHAGVTEKRKQPLILWTLADN
jgi:hypothetical protein